MNIICPGTRHRTGGFPGDSDVCPVCQRWIIIGRDTGLRRHAISKQRLADWQTRQRRAPDAGINKLWTLR